MSMFDCFAPPIKEAIYTAGWHKLNAMQEKAAHELLEGTSHLLISSGTASGKTEAAFYPLLSLLYHDEIQQKQGNHWAENAPSDKSASPGISALYIAPTKALINDQHARLAEICSACGQRLTAWHGESSRSKKDTVLAAPAGIVQITPESLESLLLRHSEDIPRLFGALHFVVIDEIHALLGQDRGMQVLCHLARIERAAGCSPRRIALSATIGNPQHVANLLASNTARTTHVIQAEPAELHWRVLVDYIERTGAGGNQTVLEQLSKLTTGQKTLLFCDARSEVEELAVALRSHAENSSSTILVHHGSLARAIRADVEELLRRDTTDVAAVATSTLELGIDIGNVARVIQLGAPASVSSLLQRLGRSGRRNHTPECALIARELPVSATTPIGSALPWELLRNIALIELYRTSRWVEPLDISSYPYGLLAHQILALLGSYGSLAPADLAARIHACTPFNHIEAGDLRDVLVHLAQTGYISQNEVGDVLLAQRGEQTCWSKDFCSIFIASPSWTVKASAGVLGAVGTPPAIGKRLTIGGAVWQVVAIDHKKQELSVVPAHGSASTIFGSGAPDIHPKVVTTMRSVLADAEPPTYLSKRAVQRLLQAQALIRETGVSTTSVILQKTTTGQNPPCWSLVPWLGSRQMRTLERLIRIHCANKLGLSWIARPSRHHFELAMTADANTFFSVVHNALAELDNPCDLLLDGEIPLTGKFDHLLPPHLAHRSFAATKLDLPGLKQAVTTWP